MQQRATQRQPLRHPARVDRDSIVAGLPEREALEEHPDALAPLRNAVEPAEEVEVLERRQLAVHECLVREIAELRAVDPDGEVAPRRLCEAREEAQERRLPAAVRPRDDREASLGHRDVHAAEHALAAVPLLEPASADHATSTSSATNTKNTTLIRPLSVKKAASRRRRSPGRTMACS